MCTAVLIDPPPPRLIWAHIRGRYLSAKIDDISLWPPGLDLATTRLWLNKLFDLQKRKFKPSCWQWRLLTIRLVITCLLYCTYTTINTRSVKDDVMKILFLRYCSKYLYTYIMTGTRTVTLLHILKDFIEGPFFIYYLVNRAKTSSQIITEFDCHLICKKTQTLDQSGLLSNSFIIH